MLFWLKTSSKSKYYSNTKTNLGVTFQIYLGLIPDIVLSFDLNSKLLLVNGVRIKPKLITFNLKKYFSSSPVKVLVPSVQPYSTTDPRIYWTFPSTIKSYTSSKK